MDYKQIEQILERYWQCDTTLDEEKQLRQFFCSDGVPRHLMRYKDLFVYQQQQHDEVCLGDDFDTRVLAQIEAPVVKAKRLTLTMRFMPLMKAAAMVAVVLTLGNLAQHSLFAGDTAPMAAADTIGKQINAPNVAQSGNVERADTNTHEQQLLDSLQRVKEEEKLETE